MTSTDGPATGTRRDLLKAALSLPLAGAAPGLLAALRPGTSMSPEPVPSARRLRAVVVGAGAFGGWTALWLRRAGAEVTLLDAWGPGHSRASSGGDSRVIRGMYGPDRLYTDWVVRSFAHWKEAEARWGGRLYHPTGALWLFQVDDGYARASLPLLRAAGLPAEQLDLAEARKRFPQVRFDGVKSVYLEQEAGYLTARRACQAVAAAVAAEGGNYRAAAARPGPIAGGALERLEIAGGAPITAAEADVFVFACGPWLGQLFPDVVGGDGIRPTRQEVFYFGTPAGDPRFREEGMPVWIDFGERIFYGIPGNEHRGFKVADDTRGAPLDPTTAERTVTAADLERARGALARRFPDLAGAPLLGAEVCQYENSPDGHFLLDRHPAAANVWILGGGSGHGFKLGPALGEAAARLIAEGGAPPAQFRLARLREEADRKTQFERR